MLSTQTGAWCNESLGKYKLKPCALPYIPHVQNVNLSARPSSRKDAEQ